MSKESNETQRLCDLVKNRYQTRLDNVLLDNSFRDFGQIINSFFGANDFALFDPSKFLYLVSEARNALLDKPQRFYKKSTKKVWKNGQLIVDETTEESSEDDVTKLSLSEDNEQYITESDLLYALYLKLTKGVFGNAPKMTQEEFFDIFEDKVNKEILKKVFIEDSATFSETLSVVNAMNEIQPINYEALNTSLFKDTFIFVPTKDLFSFDGEFTNE